MSCSRCGARAARPDARFCAQCGAPLGEPTGLLTGAPAGSAGPAGLAGPSGPTPGPAGPTPAPAADPAPVADPAPAGRRRGARLALAAAVVLVLAVAGTVLAVRRTGPSAPGGDTSPATVVRRAVAAAAAKDVDRLLDLVVPAEARPLRALVRAARAAPGSVPSSVPSSVPGLPGSGPSAGLGRLARPGPWLTQDPDRLRLRTDRPAPDLAFVTAAGATPAIAVVRQGARWYLSPTTTLLEAARRELGLPDPDFARSGRRPAGAARPGDVLGDLAAAVRRHDLPRAAGLFSQQELPELAAYYPVFAFDLGLGLAGVRESVRTVTTSVQPMSDGLTKVFLESVTTSTGARYSGGCLTGTATRRCVPARLAELTGLGTPFVVVGEEGGSWRIEPVATVIEYLRTVLADGDANALYRYLQGR
jgi:hypothetical protein